jgi:transposase-like protein
MLKTCRQCLNDLEHHCFNKRSSSKDGLHPYCKKCRKSRTRDYRNRNKQALKDKAAVTRSNPAYKLSQKLYSREYRDRYPIKYRARMAVRNAIRNGSIVKGEQCQSCGSSKNIQAHHSDYSKPLAVEWLCRSCHYEWHLENEVID